MTALTARPPVIVHVVFEEGGLAADIAERLLQDLTADATAPLSRGIGIPLRFPRPGGDVRLDGARNVIVALVDDQFLAAGHIDHLSTLYQLTSDTCAFIPVALSSHAIKTAFATAGPSWMRSYFDVLNGRDPFQGIVIAVANTASKLLADTPLALRVFVSHAKADSLPIVKRIRAALDETQLGEFFDARDIPFGDDFGKVIIDSIRDCAVVAVLTDAYPTREWCRIEALEATRGKVPVVVVDALIRGRHRALPYLGGATVVRWREGEPDESAAEVIRWISLEVLRERNFKRRAATIAGGGHGGPVVAALPYAPELLTVIPLLEGDQGIVLYPDPPLGAYEYSVLANSATGVTPRTPTQVAAIGTSDLAPLRDRLIAMSISEPSNAELRERGMHRLHLTRAFVELARHLLAAGASLAYGGDLAAHSGQDRNFLELLLDLVAAYDLPGRPDRDRIRNYQPADSVAALDTDRVASINATATLVSVGGAGARSPAEALTDMRTSMTTDCNARLVLGGKLDGFTGLLPGVVEEAHLMIRARKPLYVLGGFGGAAAAVRDLLTDIPRNELTIDYQRANTPSVAAEGASTVGRDQLAARYQDLVDELGQCGLDGLNNGLTLNENNLLMASDDVEMCAALVIAGLLRRGGV